MTNPSHTIGARLGAALVAALTASVVTSARADGVAVHPPARALVTVCIFDLLGAQGGSYNFARDYVLAMQPLGADIRLRVYTDEHVAVEDFKTGQCDAVSATGMRTRQFNALAAAIDSFGATTIVRDGKVDMPASYEVVHKAIDTLASPGAAKFMVEGPYEVGGIVPLGAVFIILNDRKINSVEAAAGKRIAAFDHDKAQALMIQRIGAQPVSADVANFATKFNNGLVDIVASPALAFKPLELHRGIGSKGAIVRFPLMTLSYQLILRKDKFPPGFGEASRRVWAANYERAMQAITQAEQDIPQQYWVDMPEADALRYVLSLRETRLELVQKGIYDKRGLRILKKIRCSMVPSDSECGAPTELE